MKTPQERADEALSPKYFALVGDEDRSRLAALFAEAMADARRAAEARVADLEADMRDFATNWDCDEDAHRHGTRCRTCVAEAALLAAKAAPPPAVDELAEWKRIAEKRNQHLMNLLEVIHRDGGQYAVEHGMWKAVEDGKAEVVRLRASAPADPAHATSRGGTPLDELERLLPEVDDDEGWEATGSESDRDCFVWTPDGDGVCRTNGNAAHGATAIGRARRIAAANNALPLLIRIARLARQSLAHEEHWTGVQRHLAGALAPLDGGDM
jgi:hypothetical protein